MLRGVRRQWWKKKKSLVCVITATRCSLSVIQRKETEEERLVKKKKRHSVISAWTSQLPRGRFPCALALIAAASPNSHKAYLFLALNTASLIIQTCPMIGCACFLCLLPACRFSPSLSVHLSKTWRWTCSWSEAGFLGLAGCVRKGTGVVRENMCSYVTVQLGTPRASNVSSFIVHLNFIKENYHKLQQVSRGLLTALEAFSFSA